MIILGWPSLLKAGRWLYRYRGGLAGIVFIFLWLISSPTIPRILSSLLLILPGVSIRFWAQGYIGPSSRDRELKADRLITAGPYRYLRHPLYLGNLFLVIGVLIALAPPPFFIGLVIFLGLLEYSLIINAEEWLLSMKFGKEYIAYRAQTPLILPRFRSRFKGSSQRFSFKKVRAEVWTLFFLALVYLLILLRLQLLPE